MHSKRWKKFAKATVLFAICAVGGCDEEDAGFDATEVEDDEGRGDFKILATTTTSTLVRTHRSNCDAQPGELPLAVEFEPAQTPQQEQDIIDRLDPFEQELAQLCAADPAVEAECANLCPANGCAWMPGGSVGVDPQTAAVSVGDLMPTGVCGDQSEKVVADVTITATCACTCGEPLQPDPPQ